VTISLRFLNGEGQDCHLYDKTGPIDGSTNRLGDIPANSSVSLEIWMTSTFSAEYLLTFKIGFETNSSIRAGKVEQKVIAFQTPFDVQSHFFDGNFELIHDGTSQIANTSVMYFDTILRNGINAPLKIHGVRPTFQPMFDTSAFPIELLPGEQFSFMGKFDGHLRHSVIIRYSFEDLEPCELTHRYDNLAMNQTRFRARLEAPSMVVRAKRFPVTLTIENLTDDLIQVMMECIVAPGTFICDGFHKKRIPLFARQQTVLEFTFVAMITTLKLLPEFCVAECETTVPNGTPQVLVAPIVIAYQ
jgi:hypothetical protein